MLRGHACLEVFETSRYGMLMCSTKLKHEDGQYLEITNIYNTHSHKISRVPSTLIEIMQCCSNLQHQSLPSTNLYPEQLRKVIHHMGRLQTLELKFTTDREFWTSDYFILKLIDFGILRVNKYLVLMTNC
ncbi:uncharacterized protein [Dysidea avara]|uniref:uncharacterized protein isoform X2 n=1 Tax=Dysidea avara TaxID=196820 RepID=UPI0033236FAE